MRLRPTLLREGLLVAAAVVAGWTGAAPRPAVGQPAKDLALDPLPIDTFTLDNGLRVVVSEDHSTPVVAVSMWYHVGSAHEEEGRTGFAHLFEHMLFEETENLEDGAMDRLVTRAGGVYNGTTDTDRTAYWELLPANRVNLALWLHAERMDRLVVSPENFETQRQVVKEERRLRVDNQPYAASQMVVDTLSQDYGPYGHTPIGSMDDLDAARVEDVRAFYERYYSPGNAVLAVVGDVTVEQVRDLVGEYLGDLPPGRPAPPLPEPPPVPRADGERRVVVDDPLAQLPLVWMAYGIPPADHPDQPALTLLSAIFSGGESSRLYRRLVKDERAGLDVVSFLNRRVGPGSLLFGAIPNQGVGVDRLEALVLEEIERLREEGVTEWELDKAKNQRRAAEVTGRMRVQSKAENLQLAVLHFGDPFRVNDQLARYEAVTLDDVRRVARTYLTPGNRTVVVARPAAGGDR